MLPVEEESSYVGMIEYIMRTMRTYTSYRNNTIVPRRYSNHISINLHAYLYKDYMVGVVLPTCEITYRFNFYHLVHKFNHIGMMTYLVQRGTSIYPPP